MHLVLKGQLALKKQSNEGGAWKTFGLRATVQACVCEMSFCFFQPKLSGKVGLTEPTDLKTRLQALCLDIDHLTHGLVPQARSETPPGGDTRGALHPASERMCPHGAWAAPGPGKPGQSFPALPPGRERAASCSVSETWSDAGIFLPSDAGRCEERQSAW